MQNFVSGKPTTSFVLALCVAFYLPTPAWASPVDSAIVRVRLYTDRAEVTRRMRTEVSPGPSSLTLRQLPSALVPGSVRLRQIEGESVTLNNVKTDRVHGSKFSSKGITEQEQLVKKFQSRYDALEDEIDVLHQQLEFIASLVKSDSAKNKNGDAGKSSSLALYPEAWDAVLKLVSERGLALRSAVRQAQEKADTAEDELKAAKRKLRELMAGARKLTYTVEIDISSPSRTEAVFEMTYQVRNTGWRPVYYLKADTQTKKMSLEYFGEIYQRTGEDWNNVELELSTGAPALGARIPELLPWIVDFRKPEPPVIMQKMDRGEIQSDRMMGLPMKQTAELRVSGASITATGTAMLFRISDRQSISSGVNNHRARIARMSLDMSLKYRSVPKLSPFVYLSAEIVNQSDYHWLPGKGLVYVDGGFVGHSRIESVASGQKLNLGLGIDRELRIERKLVKKEGALEGMFGKRNRMRYVFDIEIENFKKDSVTLEVVDQLPLPYQKDIHVTENKIDPPPKERDEKNRLTWDISLAPKEKKIIRMDYQVEYPEGKELTGLN